MKQLFLIFIFISGLAMGQDKPRVFVQGKGSQNVTSSALGGGGRHWGSWGARSTIDSHDETMEVTRDMQEDCSDVIVTLNRSNADYTVMLNREPRQNRGLRANSQVQVANRLGDVLGTNATRTVGNASKDACQLILADWSRHGRTTVPDSPASAPAAAPVVPATMPAPAEATKVETVPAVQPQPTTGATGSTSATPVAATSSTVKLQIDSTPPGADIEVDGGFVGNTPSDVQVAEGDHTVIVKKSGFKNWERTLKSSAGNSVHLGVELAKADNP
jgi:PEGA domain